MTSWQFALPPFRVTDIDVTGTIEHTEIRVVNNWLELLWDTSSLEINNYKKCDLILNYSKSQVPKFQFSVFKLLGM